MGQVPSDSDSLVEQGKETATVAFEAAKDKAAPALQMIKEDYIEPSLMKAKEAASQAYDVASTKV